MEKNIHKIFYRRFLLKYYTSKLFVTQWREQKRRFSYTQKKINDMIWHAGLKGWKMTIIKQMEKLNEGKMMIIFSVIKLLLVVSLNYRWSINSGFIVNDNIVSFQLSMSFSTNNSSHFFSAHNNPFNSYNDLIPIQIELLKLMILFQSLYN